MANALKLYCDWTSKTLVKSMSDHSIFTLPTFFKYETVPLEISIVEPGASRISDWTKLDVSNISLTVSLNDTLDDASPWCLQDTWTKDTAQNTLTGNLVLNTAAANAGLTTDSMSAWFEIMLVEGSSRTKIYRAQVTFAKGIATTTATSPNPAVEYYTKGEIDGRMVVQYNSAGVTVTLLSPSGTYARTFGVDDDGNPVDTITQIT